MKYKPDKRALIISIVWSVLFSIGIHIGYSFDKHGELSLGNPLWYVSILGTLIVAAIAAYMIIVWPVGTGGHKDLGGHKVFLRNWIIILGCWIPVFLAEYPGFFVYDATDEYVEVATRTFTTHHPLLHVLMLGGSVCAGHKITGDYNTGIAMFILCQMIVVSAVFAWVSMRLRRVSVLWFALFPTVVMFALCSVKDTLFAIAMMVAVVLTVEKKNWKSLLILAISLVTMMLLRRNGVYGFLVYAIVAVICTVCVSSTEDTKMRLKKGLLVLAFMAIVLGSYKLVDFTLAKVTHAEDIENQEIITVPIQQVARTWSVYHDEMDEADLELLYRVLPEDALRRYTPDLSDPVKMDFDNSAYVGREGEYARLWWKLFKEHPMSYINAWIGTSYGYYYPWTVVNVYAGHEMYTFTYTESSYFGYEVETPGERHSLIPVIDRFYRWLSHDDDIQRIPVVNLFFSMGALFWVYMLCAGVMIYRRRWINLCAITLPGAVWMTLLLGPTFLPRYTVFLWFMLPYVIHLAFDKEEKIN